MSGSSNSTVYIGNLDDRVSERVLYDILIQAGRVVDLYLPRDKETDKRKGFAFAEFESDEVANYAVKLFSGLVSLHNRTLKFAISGQDKVSHNMPAPSPSTLAQNASNRPRTQPVPINGFSSQPANYNNYEYSRRVFGSTVSGMNHHRSRPRRSDSGDPVSYSSY